MKCELCGWAEKPESVPAMSRHIGTYHQDVVPNQVVVWREAEMICVDHYDGEETLINVDVKKIHPLIKPSIIENFEASLVTESADDFNNTPHVIDLDEQPE